MPEDPAINELATTLVGELNEKLESPLNYIVLEEVNTRSSVNYQARITNRDKNA